MANYTTADEIAAYLGVTFTPEQAAQAELVATAVTTSIDRRTGQTWQTASPITGELANVLPAGRAYPGAYGVVFLAARPVAAVTAIALRSAAPNAAETVLEAPAWELLDPDAGVVTLTTAGGVAYPDLLAVVDYAHAAAAAPADIALAATMLSAELLRTTLNPGLAGVESLALGQNDISIKYAASSASNPTGPTASALAIVDGYRTVVLA